jgi:hypothetical protein
MNNDQYLKLSGEYQRESWLWKMALIYAKANETASANSVSYNHETNTTFYSNYHQDKNMGLEIDFGTQYQWNPNIVVHANLGYHIVGKYYEFSNTATPLKRHNTMALNFGVGVEF